MRISCNYIKISPANLSFSYALFHGLVYYCVLFVLFKFVVFPQGMFRIITSSLFLLASIALYVINQKAGNVKSTKRIGSKWIFAYFIFSGVSLFWSENLDYSVFNIDLYLAVAAMWFNFLIEFAVIYILCQIDSFKSIFISYLKGLRLGGVILAVFFLVIWFMGGQEGRLTPLSEEGKTYILHHNFAGIKLSISLFASLFLYFEVEKSKSKWYWNFAYFIPMFLGLLLTVAKTNFIAFAIGFLAYLFLTPGQMKVKALMIFVFAILMAYAGSYIFVSLNHYVETGSYLTLTERVPLWQITWEEALKKPVFGHGIATPLPAMRWNANVTGYTGEAHNLYINAFYQMGVVGLVIIIGLYLSFFKSVLLSLKRKFFHSNAKLALSIFILMFGISLTASSPAGFYIPLEFQFLLLLSLSNRYADLVKPNNADSVCLSRI